MTCGYPTGKNKNGTTGQVFWGEIYYVSSSFWLRLQLLADLQEKGGFGTGRGEALMWSTELLVGKGYRGGLRVAVRGRTSHPSAAISHR